MPLQNRVTPLGEFTDESWRGQLMGNRGCLHDADGRIGARRWRHQNWVCCVTAFRGRDRHPMPPGRWTALFFWDEPAALAAGHRPCGECRFTDYRRYVAAWTAADLPGDGPVARDRVLHRARVARDRSRVFWQAEARQLPDGVFVLSSGAPALLWQGALRAWDGGYGGPLPLPTGAVTVVTPEPTVRAMAAGYAVVPRL